MINILTKRFKNLKIRIQNKHFSYILKRIFLPFLPQISGHFYIENRFLYNAFIFPQWTKFLKTPSDYSYIITGSHGVGFVALIKFFEIIKANPMPLDHLYFSADPLLLIKNHAKKHQNDIYGISIDKTYTDPHRIHILSKMKQPVPVFCIVRDPISILRTHTHVYLLPILCSFLRQNCQGGGGIRTYFRKSRVLKQG